MYILTQRVLYVEQRIE